MKNIFQKIWYGESLEGVAYLNEFGLKKLISMTESGGFIIKEIANMLGMAVIIVASKK